MKRILFVDDEPRVLEGLRDMLHRYRRAWTMAFVGSGAEALELMARETFDVVVTDMRMPGMDGSVLLTRVQEAYPGTVRIVLSGSAELEAALRALPVAHQFLLKPCRAEVLENVVQRACSLQSLISDERFREQLGKLDRLPSQPKVYAALTRAMADERSTMDTIASIVEQDAGICLKVLQLVNSAFFGLGKPVGSVKQAVSYLGFNVVRNLVLATEVFSSQQYGTLPMAFLEQNQRHALAVANVASLIARDSGSKQDDAFIAGLLHDIGHVILAAERPAEFAELRARARDGTQPDFVVEEEAFGVSHAEIGAYLLGIWGLPYPVVEAVANHHRPERVTLLGPDILAAVTAAEALVQDAECGTTTALVLVGGQAPVDPARLAAWRAVAAESVGPSGTPDP